MENLCERRGVRDKETRDAVSSDFIVVETLDYTVSPGTNCSEYSVGVDSREGFYYYVPLPKFHRR